MSGATPFLHACMRAQGHICFYFLGALPTLRKATISFVMSVRVEQLGSHWTDFHEIGYLNV